eukprot:353712_1
MALAARNAKHNFDNELFFYGFDSDDTTDSQTPFMPLSMNLFPQSDILSSDEQMELSELISTSLEIRNISFESANLIFNAKRDGFTHHSFYNKCDNKRNTMILIQSAPTKKNDYAGNKIIFGGFITKKW